MKRNRHNPESLHCLAWAGWQMKVPGTWRPVCIEGDYRSGHIILADGTEAIMQVKWWRPSGRRFDADRWLSKRLASIKAGDRQLAKPVAPPGFEPVACVAAGGRRKWQNCLLWYGYNRPAELVLEVAVRQQTAGGSSEAALKRLRSLMASPVGEPDRWALMGSSFLAPVGFKLKHHSLRLGDMALRMSGPKGQTLILRQVYPADLALSRRGLKDWVNTAAFLQRRKYRLKRVVTDWVLETDDGCMEGVICFGQKRLAFPLGRLALRHTAGAVVHDQTRGRLLIAEHDARQPVDELLLKVALARMNRDDEHWQERTP